MSSPSPSSSLLKLAARGWIAICGLYFLWEATQYRGFFGRLAELQIKYFGSYAPLLTFLFLFCLTALPAWLVLRILRKREREAQQAEPAVTVQIRRAKRLRTILYGFAGVTAIVAMTFVIFALFMLPGSRGNAQTIAASDVGTVAIGEGPTRLVGGEIGTIVLFGQDWFLGDNRMAFAPYRAAGKDGALARLFVQLDASNRTRLAQMGQRPAWSGILVEGGLPGTARVLFNSIGVGISKPYYTLYRDEFSLKIRYWTQSIQWALLTAFLLIFGRLQTRRIEKLEKNRPPISA